MLQAFEGMGRMEADPSFLTSDNRLPQQTSEILHRTSVTAREVCVVSQHAVEAPHQIEEGELLLQHEDEEQRAQEKIAPARQLRISTRNLRILWQVAVQR